MNKATQIVDQMYEKDAFSQWLGIERVEEREGYSKLRMIVRQEMCNGFGIAHGGISYSLADSAFAFASNSRGRLAVSIETTISHIEPLHAGDVLLAEATEDVCKNKTGWYTVRVMREGDGKLVALFKGTVYRMSKEW
jgi:acyl-CoA thioesterase